MCNTTICNAYNFNKISINFSCINYLIINYIKINLSIITISSIMSYFKLSSVISCYCRKSIKNSAKLQIFYKYLT